MSIIYSYILYIIHIMDSINVNLFEINTLYTKNNNTIHLSCRRWSQQILVNFYLSLVFSNFNLDRYSRYHLSKKKKEYYFSCLGF